MTTEEEHERDAKTITAARDMAATHARQDKDDHDIVKTLVIEIRTTGQALRNAIAQCTASFDRAMIAIEMAGNTWEAKAMEDK